MWCLANNYTIVSFNGATPEQSCFETDLITRIICRAFQGIGGSGIYSLASLMFYELGPPSTFAGYTSLVSAVFALAFVLGPIFGGLINKSSTWRWIFLPK